MTSVVTRWGKTLAVRLPHRLADSAGFSEGTEVDIRADKRGLLITHARPRYKLSELLRDCDASRSGGEVAWGRARGKEFS